MKCVAAILVLMLGAGSALGQTVSNVRASQQPSGEVRVVYDLSGGVPPLYAQLEASTNGGTNWTVPVTSLSGNGFTPPVSPGQGKVIVWNAIADWPGQVTSRMRFRVSVSQTPPAPAGMALIPAGSFSMGNQMASNEGSSDELPVHTVYVSAFYMDRYEVTKALWDEVRAWGLTNGYTDLPVGGGKAANHPAYYVTWYEAVKWCNARSKKENLTECYTVGGAVMKTGTSTPDCNFSANGYRLPTEAEWEKAARGGSSGKRFPWGDTITHSQANYYSYSSYSYDVSPTRGYHPTYATGSTPYSSPVGSFAPNGYGLYDMAGNMWEWCWDWYSSSYYASSPSSDPRGASSGSYRVYRGGSWISGADGTRTADRGFNYPGNVNYGVGFRCARSSVP